MTVRRQHMEQASDRSSSSAVDTSGGLSYHRRRGWFELLSGLERREAGLDMTGRDDGPINYSHQ